MIFSEDQSYLAALGMLSMYRTMTDLCEEIVVNKEIMDKLRAFKFEVAISEQLDLCGVGVSHLLGIESHIWLSSTPMMEQVSYFAGVPTPLSYVPVSMEADLPDKMTYWQRFENIIAYAFSLGFHRYGSTSHTKMFRKRFGADFPDLDTLAGSSPLVFVSSEEFIDFPRPILHKTVYIGGLGLKNAKPLDSKFEQLMSIGKKGTVFVSLGSVVQTSAMPKSLKSTLFDAFTVFPDYCFLFKIDAKDTVSKELAVNLKNVKLVEWAPQVDLFGHPNLRAFVTHGGLNSLMEASYAGVPIVTIGMFADQMRNGRAAERNGYGVPLSKLNLTVPNIATALRTVLENKSFKESAQRISRLMRRKPFQAEERLVQWTEFLAEFKQLPELDVHARNLNFI
uniref:glucuronosyltransferase n=1 Tax=Plectus sambesii TaxID=2011161 RepID=A0A914VC94_9BILA